MDAFSLKTKFCLDHTDLPNPQGTVAEIARIDSSYDVDKTTNEEYVRHELYFKGVKIPLRLNNMRIDILVNLLGRDTDAWVGRKVGMYVGLAQKYGKNEPAILLHQQAVDSIPVTEWPKHLQVVDRYKLPAGPAFNGSATFTAKPALPAAAPGPVPRDTKPIGAKNADRLKQALAEQGATTDDLLAWMRRINEEAFTAMHGRELSDYPVWTAPLMQRFLKEYAAPPVPPPAPIEVDFSAGLVKQPEPAIPSPPDDDIPF